MEKQKTLSSYKKKTKKEKSCSDNVCKGKLVWLLSLLLFTDQEKLLKTGPNNK